MVGPRRRFLSFGEAVGSVAVEVPQASREEVIVVPRRAFLGEGVDQVGASAATQGLTSASHDRKGVAVFADEGELEAGQGAACGGGLLLRFHLVLPFGSASPPCRAGRRLG